MKIAFRGGAREVGRSCIEIETEGDRYLLDAGVKFLEDGFAYPEGVLDHDEIDGLFLSHAHLDHSGALPLFEHKNLICPVIGTPQTKAITRILLRDSYKVARIKHIHPAYSRGDIKQIWKSYRTVDWDTDYKLNKVKYRLHNAGHIPGSAVLELLAEGKRIVYTGDFNTRETRLMKAAAPEFSGKVDLLITESTYGDKDLPNRHETEERFKQRIRETIGRGGRVLIPVFALGRSQEVLIMLAKENFGVPVYFDGMCKDLTRKILANPSKYVQNKNDLAECFFNKVELVGSQKRRERVAQKPGIFITTSGMMQGGPAMSYLQHMWADEKSSILLMGFQCRNTNGRHLLEEGFVYLDGWRTYPKCHYEKFDFSGHLSREDIQEFVRKVNPRKVAFVHGDPQSIDWLTDWATRETDSKVYGPSVGDEIEL